MIDERLGSNPGRLRFLDPSGGVTPTKDLICQPCVSSDAYRQPQMSCDHLSTIRKLHIPNTGIPGVTN